MSVIRPHQRALTAVLPHQGNRRYAIPKRRLTSERDPNIWIAEGDSNTQGFPPQYRSYSEYTTPPAIANTGVGGTRSFDPNVLQGGPTEPMWDRIQSDAAASPTAGKMLITCFTNDIPVLIKASEENRSAGEAARVMFVDLMFLVAQIRRRGIHPVIATAHDVQGVMETNWAMSASEVSSALSAISIVNTTLTGYAAASRWTVMDTTAINDPSNPRYMKPEYTVQSPHWNDLATGQTPGGTEGAIIQAAANAALAAAPPFQAGPAEAAAQQAIDRVPDASEYQKDLIYSFVWFSATMQIWQKTYAFFIPAMDGSELINLARDSVATLGGSGHTHEPGNGMRMTPSSWIDTGFSPWLMDAEISIDGRGLAIGALHSDILSGTDPNPANPVWMGLNVGGSSLNASTYFRWDNSNTDWQGFIQSQSSTEAAGTSVLDGDGNAITFYNESGVADTQNSGVIVNETLSTMVRAADSTFSERSTDNLVINGQYSSFLGTVNNGMGCVNRAAWIINTDNVAPPFLQYMHTAVNRMFSRWQ